MAKDPVAAAKAAAEKINKSVAAGTRGSARRAKGKPTDGEKESGVPARAGAPLKDAPATGALKEPPKKDAPVATKKPTTKSPKTTAPPAGLSSTGEPLAGLPPVWERPITPVVRFKDASSDEEEETGKPPARPALRSSVIVPGAVKDMHEEDHQDMWQAMLCFLEDHKHA